MHNICVSHANSTHLTKFQVNNVANNEVIRQNVFSHARVIVIGVEGDFKPPVALAAFHSKAVFLMLLTHCLLLFPLFDGLCVWSFFCYVYHST